ncbi:MAG: hypothetical protein JWM27_3960 [Gemmatimonadetes bacterium]|nr:hypothetical protein [Gemmatimonadota bacterium]
MIREWSLLANDLNARAAAVSESIVDHTPQYLTHPAEPSGKECNLIFFR